MSRRLAFRVEYDGTDYHGWQAQQDGRPTIQGTLERAFEAFTGAPAKVDGASRTDAGVHAQDQLAATTLEHPVACEGLIKAINRRLPDAIAIRDVREVPLDFAPRFANQGKIYRYRFRLGRERCPLLDRFAWRVPFTKLDLTQMVWAAGHLIGTHDFQSFAASDGTHKSSIRTLNCIALEPADERGVYTLRFEGTAFLKYMVRNLVGTLIDVARGQIRPDAMPAILKGRLRDLAGRTAPAHGLTLAKIAVDWEAVLKAGLNADAQVQVGGGGVPD